MGVLLDFCFIDLSFACWEEKLEESQPYSTSIIEREKTIFGKACGSLFIFTSSTSLFQDCQGGYYLAILSEIQIQILNNYVVASIKFSGNYV